MEVAASTHCVNLARPNKGWGGSIRPPEIAICSIVQIANPGGVGPKGRWVPQQFCAATNKVLETVPTCSALTQIVTKN
jgi:hypothetical protein